MTINIPEFKIENALAMKLSHSKYNHCLCFNREKTYRTIIPKYNEHLSHKI